MNADEQKTFVDTIKTQVNGLINEQFKGIAKKDEVEVMINKLHESFKDNPEIKELKSLAENLEKSQTLQGEALLKLQENGGKNTPKTFKEQVYDAVSSDMFKNNISKGINSFNILKVVGDFTSGGNLSGTYPILPDRKPFVNILDRPMFMRDIMRVNTTIKDRIDFVTESNREGAPASATEVAVSQQIDFDLVESSVVVERVAAYMNISKNSLDDIDYLTSLINQSGINRLLTVEDTLILSGTGTTPQISGLITNATAFAAGAFANAVPYATEIDVLRRAANQLTVGYYRPTNIVMHPTDVALMDVVKDKDGQYVMFGSRYDSLMPSIWRIPVFETTAITQGTYLVGDFINGCELLDRRALRVDMTESHADNFTHNLATIRFEERIALPIYRPAAFITGTFVNDIAAITIP